MRETQESRRPKESHELRWGGLAGVGAVVFAILGRLMMTGAPKITDSSGTITSFVSDNRGQILTASVFYAIALALFVWFGAALATAFHRAEETSDAPLVLLAGVAVSAAIGFIAISMLAGMSYAATVHKGLMTIVPGAYTGAAVVSTIAGIALAVPLVAAAVATLYTHAFPAWMAWLAVVAAALAVLAALAVSSTKGPLTPGSALTQLPGILVGLWVLGMSGLLIREHLPAIPRRVPHPMGA